MSYQSLTKEKKTSIELPDVAFQSSSLSQLIELNHTRRIVLLLTGIQFVSSSLLIYHKSHLSTLDYSIVHYCWYYLCTAIWL